MLEYREVNSFKNFTQIQASKDMQIYYGHPELRESLPEKVGKISDLCIYSCDKYSIFMQPKKSLITTVTSVYGWKFQISINDSVENNMEKAWNIIKEIFLRFGFPACKVIKNDVHLDNEFNPWERGKQTTIYTFAGLDGKNDVRLWEILLQSITDELAAAHIEQSYIPCNCKKLSPYISYRNDKKAQGGYLDDEESLRMVEDVKEAYNPFRNDDPFLVLNIRQPEGIVNPEFNSEDMVKIKKLLKKPYSTPIVTKEGENMDTLRNDEICITMDYDELSEEQHMDRKCCPCCKCTIL